MSIMMSKDKKELIVACKCLCGDTVHFCKIEDTDDTEKEYAFMTYLNSNWYNDQDKKIGRVIKDKLKKILGIIRNKDYYYSDIVMSKEDFQQFKDYINQFGE
ncbi:hypothetical protein F140042L4_20370 [Coprococcus phoceensis]